MAIKNGRDMYTQGIDLLYSVESQIMEALPKMIKKAEHEELKECLQTHLEQTRKQRDRLMPILQRLGVKPGQVQDKGFAAMLQEGEKMMKELEGSPCLDAGMILGAQKVEHYEIAIYGSAVNFAKILGFEEDVRALHQTLEEEKETDEKLSDIAEGGINEEALQAA